MANDDIIDRIVQNERKRIVEELEKLPRFLSVSQPHEGVSAERNSPDDYPSIWSCWYAEAVLRVVNPANSE